MNVCAKTYFEKRCQPLRGSGGNSIRINLMFISCSDIFLDMWMLIDVWCYMKSQDITKVSIQRHMKHGTQKNKVTDVNLMVSVGFTCWVNVLKSMKGFPANDEWNISIWTKVNSQHCHSYSDSVSVAEAFLAPLFQDKDLWLTWQWYPVTTPSFVPADLHWKSVWYANQSHVHAWTLLNQVDGFAQ